MKKPQIDCKTAFGYAFIHFSMEVLCFSFLYRVFEGGPLWWGMAMLYDAVAFAGQVPVGKFCEKHSGFRPGLFGTVMLMTGAGIGYFFFLLFTPGRWTTPLQSVYGIDLSSWRFFDTGQKIVIICIFTGFVIMSIGNAFLHISGALVTLRVSGGRMSEPGIFVGGGAFGVVTGRLIGSGSIVIGHISSDNALVLIGIPFALMAVSLVLTIVIDRRIHGAGEEQSAGSVNFAGIGQPAGEGFFPDWAGPELRTDSRVTVILILAGIIAVRSYISNGIPMQWKNTVFETVLLFVAMGAGKMAGGVLADMFGGARVGAASCLLAVPLILLGNDLMWISLLGIMLFSMTMAITLGGIVSAMRSRPGTAFGITTLALFAGTLPVFFVPMPPAFITNILLAVLSFLSAAGIFVCIKDHSCGGLFSAGS